MAKGKRSGGKLGKDLFLRYLFFNDVREKTLRVFSQQVVPLIEAGTFDEGAFRVMVGSCHKNGVPSDLLRYLLRARLALAVATKNSTEIANVTSALLFLHTPRTLIEHAKTTGTDFRTKHRNCECAGALAASYFFAEVFDVELELTPVEEESESEE